MSKKMTVVPQIREKTNTFAMKKVDNDIVLLYCIITINTVWQEDDDVNGSESNEAVAGSGGFA